MDRLKVGDEVAIAAIVKITAIQPQNNGTVSYSTDRGISIHEELLEQIKIKSKPVVERECLEPNERVVDPKFKVGEEVRTRFGLCRILDVASTPYCVVDIKNTRHWLTEEQIHPTISVIKSPKLYTGKVVCIDVNPSFASDYPVGVVFSIENGILQNPTHFLKRYAGIEYKDFVYFCKTHPSAKWLELKS